MATGVNRLLPPGVCWLTPQAAAQSILREQQRLDLGFFFRAFAARADTPCHTPAKATKNDDMDVSQHREVSKGDTPKHHMC